MSKKPPARCARHHAPCGLEGGARQTIRIDGKLRANDAAVGALDTSAKVAEQTLRAAFELARAIRIACVKEKLLRAKPSDGGAERLPELIIRCFVVAPQELVAPRPRAEAEFRHLQAVADEHGRRRRDEWKAQHRTCVPPTADARPPRSSRAGASNGQVRFTRQKQKLTGTEPAQSRIAQYNSDEIHLVLSSSQPTSTTTQKDRSLVLRASSRVHSMRKLRTRAQGRASRPPDAGRLALAELAPDVQQHHEGDEEQAEHEHGRRATAHARQATARVSVVRCVAATARANKRAVGYARHAASAQPRRRAGTLQEIGCGRGGKEIACAYIFRPGASSV